MFFRPPSLFSSSVSVFFHFFRFRFFQIRLFLSSILWNSGKPTPVLMIIILFLKISAFFQLHKIPIGTKTTESRLDEVCEAVKNSNRLFLTNSLRVIFTLLFINCI